MRLLPIACSFLLLAGGALASPPETGAAATPGGEAEEVAEPEAVSKVDRHCLRETGSRIKRKGKDGCLPLAGRSYSKDDLDSTGAATVAEALERLDPAIRRGH